jgi:DNA modification methylase
MIIHGDCLEEMKKMDANSISCIVTDPPYGLGFMNKDWDAGLPHHDIWKEALRICKPGAFLLAFGGTRTYHRLTYAIEDSGWQIRDCIMWIYGSGFPKSHNHFGLEGYGTALKPAYEPIIMAMKRCEGTYAQNAQKHGQAGININECRIACNGDLLGRRNKIGRNGQFNTYGGDNRAVNDPIAANGRWPANVIFDEEAGRMLDEQSGNLKSGLISPHHKINQSRSTIYEDGLKETTGLQSFGDSGGASRFFYCAKASSSERGKDNKHPTVKPIKLMEYLIKLVMPPKDGLLLDPFAGSGTTILAAKRLGFKAIGIEKCHEYCEIANARIDSEKSLMFG